MGSANVSNGVVVVSMSAARCASIVRSIARMSRPLPAPAPTASGESASASRIRRSTHTRCSPHTSPPSPLRPQRATPPTEEGANYCDLREPHQSDQSAVCWRQ
jgi:hypothetical protein